MNEVGDDGVLERKIGHDIRFLSICRTRPATRCRGVGNPFYASRVLPVMSLSQYSGMSATTGVAEPVKST